MNENEKAPDGREQITLRLPPELNTYVQKEATKRGLSINAFLIILINKAIGSINLLDKP